MQEGGTPEEGVKKKYTTGPVSDKVKMTSEKKGDKLSHLS